MQSTKWIAAIANSIFQNQFDDISTDIRRLSIKEYTHE